MTEAWQTVNAPNLPIDLLVTLLEATCACALGLALNWLAKRPRKHLWDSPQGVTGAAAAVPENPQDTNLEAGGVERRTLGTALQILTNSSSSDKRWRLCSCLAKDPK